MFVGKNFIAMTKISKYSKPKPREKAAQLSVLLLYAMSPFVFVKKIINFTKKY